MLCPYRCCQRLMMKMNPEMPGYIVMPPEMQPFIDDTDSEPSSSSD